MQALACVIRAVVRYCKGVYSHEGYEMVDKTIIALALCKSF